MMFLSGCSVTNNRLLPSSPVQLKMSFPVSVIFFPFCPSFLHLAWCITVSLLWSLSFWQYIFFSFSLRSLFGVLSPFIWFPVLIIGGHRWLCVAVPVLSGSVRRWKNPFIGETYKGVLGKFRCSLQKVIRGISFSWTVRHRICLYFLQIDSD